MAKFICSIDVRYLPNWGTAEGLREMLQNGKDAEIQFNAKLTVRHRPHTQILVVENEGCTLPLKSLLIGFSTKRDDRRLAGQYGEGLVFGILALVRGGHAVKIRTGGEVWIPRIERHDQADADVLVFQINPGREEKKRVAIEIDHVPEVMYKELPKKFLFLANDKETDERVKTNEGTLILSQETRGDLYVKGIWVCHDPELAFAYDFADCDTDRDRKMIDTYDLRYAMRKVWASALRARPDLTKDLMKIIMDEYKDALGIDEYGATYFDETTRKKIAADFRKTFGDDAVPVSTLAESEELDHMGRRGVMVPKAWRALLETIFGKLSEIRANLAKEGHKKYGWNDLTREEQENLAYAINTAHRVEDAITIDKIDVVDFRDEKIDGLWKDDRIFLAKKSLASRSKALLVLVHEFAHLISMAGDGDKDHVSTIESLWSRIVDSLTHPKIDEDAARNEAFRRATLE